MKVPFENRRLTVVVAPVDMRSGYRRLAALAHACLLINLDLGQDVVAFISKRRNVCKVIWKDDRGTAVLVRKLHQGRFEQFLLRANESSGKSCTIEELEQFLDGDPIFQKRTRLI